MAGVDVGSVLDVGRSPSSRQSLKTTQVTLRRLPSEPLGRSTPNPALAAACATNNQIYVELDLKETASIESA
jgi:hypothetical protein